MTVSDQLEALTNKLIVIRQVLFIQVFCGMGAFLWSQLYADHPAALYILFLSACIIMSSVVVVIFYYISMMKFEKLSGLLDDTG